MEQLSTEAAPEQQPPSAPFSVDEVLRGRRILLTGTTGFLGKVVGSMLLRYHADIERLYLMIRPGKQGSAQDRFEQQVITSGAFDPVREVYQAGFDDFIADKIKVVSGDLTQDDLGFDDDVLVELREGLDLFLNSAGLVDFNPSLEASLSINTRGLLRIVEFVKSCDRAKLLHVSTCYVTGTRDGVIREDEAPYGFYPRRDEMRVPFSPERELEDCQAIIDAIYAQADDQNRQAIFSRDAREKLKDENLPIHNEVLFKAEVKRQRQRWIRKTLKEEGKRRAEHWGWTNTYTYSKSLGEQLAWQHRDEVEMAFVRPAIVESALSFPKPGWNSGFNTSGPLIYLSYKGMRFIPAGEGVNLDLIPVDAVSRAIVTVSAALLVQRAKPIYQVGTSDRSPMSMRRLIELTSLSNRQFYAQRVSVPKWQNMMMNALESIQVDRDRYERFSAPGVKKAANRIGKLATTLSRNAPGGVRTLLGGVRSTARKVERQSGFVDMIVETFKPFIYDNRYTFKTDNLDALRTETTDGQWIQDLWDLNWRHYFLEVHVPGLHRNVFPEIDAQLASSRKEVYTYQDLCELFDASTENHSDRVAMQQFTPDGLRRITYNDLRTRAHWMAASLRRAGLGQGDRVLIMSENRPEWGMTYFGTLEAGGATVPVDAELPLRDVLTVIRSSRAFALVASDKVRDRLEAEGLTEALDALTAATEEAADAGAEATAAPKVFSFNALLEAPKAPEANGASASAALVPVERANDIASLIYTSGTTGNPKGVMLEHRNFAAMLSSVNGIFNVSHRDSFLSVLPLHHTFEFTAGFLMPLSRGATITYLDELTAESLGRAFREAPPTAMIGVPALWQLLHRRVLGEVARRGPYAKGAFKALMMFNRWVRERTGVNLGKVLFAPVHGQFGGRVRYFISGGASLPAPVMEAFYGLGFELLEGYGLTEAAPVLTCTRPGDTFRVGSVGRALPDIEVRIDAPDDSGVGEVVAKGGNVMRGYWNNEEATSAAIDEDGWLHTGDLGRMNRKGHLYIVGRKKDVIVSADGENVYPDELEEHFRGCDLIEELSIVGLPDGKGSERVAALMRPVEDLGGLSLDEAQAEIRRHVDVQNARLNYAQRIKLLRFTNDELPRTATRKVQRKEVVQLLEEMLQVERGGDDTHDEVWGDWSWLREQIADLADVEVSEVGIRSALAEDLSFDSLSFMELAGLVKERTGKVLAADQLIEAATAEKIVALIDGVGGHEAERLAHSASIAGFSHLPPSMRPQTVRREKQRPLAATFGDMTDIPEPLRAGIKDLLERGQLAVYGDMFDVKVTGAAHIPYHSTAIVAANHSSHLDMGLVKHALRDWAPDLATLAAADYFFDTPAKRTYFGQLTNLIPMERSGSLDHSMGQAVRAVEQGKPLLLFPEGTRSTTGEIAAFRSGLGYLVMQTRQPVLPVFLRGTHRALPKGSVVPKKRRLEVVIGEPIPYSFFEPHVEGMSPKKAYATIANLVRDAVLALKAGKRFLDPPSQEDDAALSEALMIQGLFEKLGGQYQSNQIDSRVMYYFSLGNEPGGKWTVEVEPEQCRCWPGKPPHADCVVKTSTEIFRKMVDESYVPSMDEFMSGKVKTNNPQLLIRFQSVFGL